MCAATYLTLPSVRVAHPQPPRELRAPRQRIQPRRSPAATLVLRDEQEVRVVTPCGQLVASIGWSDAGPVVQLGNDDFALHLAGKLAIQADSIDLTARAGDVVVRGEMIRLN
jgi:hypothetical protein